MAVVQGAFHELLKPGLVKDIYEAIYPGKLWFAEEGFYLDIADEEGEPIYDEDEPWWMI